MIPVRALKEEGGLTMIELLAALLILSLLVVGAYSFYFSGVRSWQKGVQRMDYQQSARIAIEKMDRELRFASGVQIPHPGQINFNFKGDPNTYIFRLAGEELVFESTASGRLQSHIKVALGITSLSFEQDEDNKLHILISAGSGAEQVTMQAGVRPRNQP